MIYINNKLLAKLALTIALLIPASSFADDKLVDILPTTAQVIYDDAQDISSPTHPDLKLTPDKSELIRLDSDAGSIIIGNPAHINVIADSSTTLVIVPRAIGATHFTVLDKNGQIIMQRHVIVASPKENYIRIKRVCADNAPNCQSTSVLYCPDMCHEIKSVEDTEKASTQSEASQSSNGNNSNSNTPPLETEE